VIDLKSLARVMLEPVRRALPVSIDRAIGQGRIFNRTVAGANVRWLITNRGDEIQAQQLRDGFYELAELKCLHEDVGPRKSIVDVGANIGNHSVYFIHFFSCEALTIIEPYPVAMHHLLANISLNFKPGLELSLYPYALGSVPGTASIIPPSDFNIGLTQVREGGDGPVQVRLGDDVLRGRPVDLIKIDVEGMELSVLGGLLQTLREQAPALYIEVSERSKSEVTEILEAHRYSIVRETRAYKDQFNVTALPHSQRK
jgi:FkbM family methyltransferase